MFIYCQSAVLAAEVKSGFHSCHHLGSSLDATKVSFPVLVDEI
jgi:hypothetical protein